MAKKPVLVVMAAGMGSRFGGLKQMTPVDEQGYSIIHYSLYDAWRAGFGKVARLKRLDRSESSHVHEDRRLHRAVRRRQPPQPGGSIRILLYHFKKHRAYFTKNPCPIPKNSVSLSSPNRKRFTRYE